MGERKWLGIAGELKLSPQQTRVVELVLRGMSDKEIAAALGLKEPTVRSHLQRARARTGATGRIELILDVFAIAENALASITPEARPEEAGKTTS